MKNSVKENHIYIIKKKVTVDIAGEPFEYDELLGKCTEMDEIEKILSNEPEAFVADDHAYTYSDLFRFTAY